MTEPRFKFVGLASSMEGPPPALVIDTKTGEKHWAEGREAGIKLAEKLNKEVENNQP